MALLRTSAAARAMSSETVARDGVASVCVRAPNWVGDVVMATPALRAIREHLPGARFGLVVRRRVAAVLRGAPWFDEVIDYAPDDGHAGRRFLRCAGRLRKGDWELGFLLPNSFGSALMFRLGRVRRRVGYARDMRSILLTDAVPRPSRDGRFKATYMVDYYLGLCARVGIPPSGRQMELFFDDADMAEAQARAADAGVTLGKPLFLLHPGAGFGPSKRWPAARFARLAELLQDWSGGQVAVVAGPAERAEVDAILGQSRAAVADLSQCGIDLHLLKCVVARSELLATTDSGPRHYGVAFGVPTVCVMGPTHPDYSTSTLPHDRVVRLDVECGPCQRKVCPLDHACMEDITPEMVFEACRDALETSAGA